MESKNVQSPLSADVYCQAQLPGNGATALECGQEAVPILIR
jgi:hypothetical protein